MLQVHTLFLDSELRTYALRKTQPILSTISNLSHAACISRLQCFSACAVFSVVTVSFRKFQQFKNILLFLKMHVNLAFPKIIAACPYGSFCHVSCLLIHCCSLVKAKKAKKGSISWLVYVSWRRYFRLFLFYDLFPVYHTFPNICSGHALIGANPLRCSTVGSIRPIWTRFY